MADTIFQDVQALEYIASPIDPHEPLVPFLALPDRFNLQAGDTWQLVQGASSGLIFLNPRPTAETIGRYYEPMEYDPFISLKTNAFISRPTLHLLAPIHHASLQSHISLEARSISSR
jgi:hypothetical protein